MKGVNFVLGLATAIILAALITLGIKAFYPEPVAPQYPAYTPLAPVVPCPSADQQCLAHNAELEAQQQAQQQAIQDQYNKESDAYQAAMQIYNKNVFIIGNVVGIIVFAVGFWLVMSMMLASQAVPVGMMIAGLWSIVYGYARGWGSAGDQLKFFVGLVVAVIVIGGSMWLMQRRLKQGQGS